MIRLPPISTLFPYTTLFRSFLMSLISWISFSSTQTTGWAESYALSYTSNTSIIFVLNSGVTSGMHHIFRSEEHTSELQSHSDLVCRLLLEKKKKINIYTIIQ